MITTKKGFTLIEILIVVAIIAILASIVLVGLGPSQQSGRDARRISDLHDVQNVIELYYNRCGYYPGAAQAAIPCTAYAAGNNSYATMSAALTGSGLGVSVIPNDPSTGGTYYYMSFSGGSTYSLGAKLENPGASIINGYSPPANVPAPIPDCIIANKDYCLSL